mmetsp:Transcript_24920/g.80269  ORF Transcript_24920/g.80269 Transcript_24920/m.80269 type:complete len:302 (+) Transcript_24920:63-968(+)
MQSVNWEELDMFKFYTIGPMIFMGVRAVMYPVAVVKTRLQVQTGHSLYKGQMDAFWKIFRYEGPRGLYKGFLVNCWGILGGQFYITVYEVTRSRIMPRKYPESFRNFVAGATASLGSQTLVVPLDVVSQKMMVHGQVVHAHDATASKPSRLQGGLHVARDILARDGVRGLYRGYLASVMTYAPSSALWWSCYSMYKPFANRVVPKRVNGLKRSMVVDAVSGAGAGTTAAILTNPMDVVRARLQVYGTSSSTVWGVAQELVHAEGVRGLMKGATARVASMAPNSVLLTTAYELTKRLSRIQE